MAPSAMAHALVALVACAFLCDGAQAETDAPRAPCREEGCPNITVYLGPRWGTKVIYTDPVDLTRNGTDEKNANRTETPSRTTTPPITKLTSPPPPKSGDKIGHTTLRKEPETQLSYALKTSDTEEGVEEVEEGMPRTTSIYDRDSESDESFAEYLERLKEMRKPVPDDGSFFIEDDPDEIEVTKQDVEGYLREKERAGQVERVLPESFAGQAEVSKQDVERVLPSGVVHPSVYRHNVKDLPNTPDIGVLNWSGYQLTGEQLKKALYNLTPYVGERIRILDISNNQIRDLEPLTFPQELENNLEQLRLDDNPLQYISSSSRFELSRLKKLKILTLGRASLRSFPPLLLPSLHALDLQGNYLTEVPDTLGSIPSLAELDLSNNRISEVSEPLGLARLRILVLNRNAISTLSADAFSGCLDLQQVYLCYNQLTSVPMGLFESPAVFYLDNNPLDGELVEMLGREGAVTKPFCASCPGLPSWVYSFTLNSSLLLIALLVLLLVVLGIRSKMTRLPPYRILDEKSPM